MTLPTSGQLSLNDISIEQGNSSGTANTGLRAMSAVAGFSIPDAVNEFYGWSTSLKTDLISYWPFENTMEDIHGSNDGALQGSPKDGLGIDGSCYEWTDVTYGYMGSMLSSSINNWSISAWFDHGLTLPVVSHDCIWGWTSDYFALGCTTTGYLSAYDGDWNPTTLLTATSTWYHVVVTMDSTSGWKLYLNAGTPHTDSTVRSINTTFYVNNTQAAARTGEWDIDEVAIWDRTLSATDVSTLYNNGSGSFYASW